MISSIFNQKYAEAYFLIEKGADIKIKNKAGVTALMFAAARDAESIVSLLIKKGADVNTMSNNRETPLSFAIGYGNNPNIVRKLIDNGANINTRHSTGWTPVMLSLIYGEKKDAVTNVLLSKGADINDKDDNGQTALMYMCHYNSDERIGILKYIIDKGADINIKDNNGWSALMNAAYYGTISMGSILIDKGADLNVKSNSGKTAMDIAINNQKDEKFIRLLDPNKKSVNTNANTEFVVYSKNFKNDYMFICDKESTNGLMMNSRHRALVDASNGKKINYNEIKELVDSGQCTVVTGRREDGRNEDLTVEVHLDKKPEYITANGERYYMNVNGGERGWILFNNKPRYFWFDPYDLDIDINKL